MKIKTIYLKIISIAILALLSVFIYTQFFDHTSKAEDIYFIYLDGKQIAEGENPYARILDGDMRVNQKYPTYFPLFYLTASLIQVIGTDEYESWLSLWRILNLILTILISWLIIHHLTDKAGILAGIFGALFWQFNSFALYVVKVAQIDFLPILFLIWSMICFEKNLNKSMLLFGISLAFKQIAIFLVPIYLIQAYFNRSRWLPAIKDSAIYIGIIPFITSLPFLIWNFKAYIYSIFFSATRNPASHFRVPSIDTILELDGWMSMIPMILLMVLAYLLFFKKKIEVFLAGILILQIFIGFNSVLFKQYLVWPLLLIPFLIYEFNENYRVGAKSPIRK